MKSHQYLVSGQGKNKREIWVCDLCKQKNVGLILLRHWRLIDQKDGDAIPCDVCGGGMVEVREPASLQAHTGKVPPEMNI